MCNFNEEALLAEQNHPSEYNVSVLFPAKTVLNVNYLKKYHLLNDLKYIYKIINKKKFGTSYLVGSKNELSNLKIAKIIVNIY